MKIPRQVTELYKKGRVEDAKKLEESLKTSPTYRQLFPGSVVTEEWLSKILNRDPETENLKDDIRLLVILNEPVLILGETGTGKEIIARALHGPRKDPFIPINCTSLPDYLLESELFGHVKGSFTGAICDKEGIFQEVKKGTVFLDEIGDMPVTLQAKLLRVLQDNKIRPVGSNKEIEIHCRFICATNRNMEELLSMKLFRADLYYRISSFILHTKPVRNWSKEDVKLLVKSLDDSGVFPFEDWFKSKGELEGNVREIQQVVKRWNILERL